MEAHEDFLVSICVTFELLTLDTLFIHILRYRVVDVKKCHSVLSDASADILRQCTIYIYLTCYRNSATCQTTVHITRYEAEHCLECRPALICHSNVLA